MQHPGLVRPVSFVMDVVSERLDNAKDAYENGSLRTWLGTSELRDCVARLDHQVSMLQNNKHYQAIQLPDLDDFVQVVWPRESRNYNRTGTVIDVHEVDRNDSLGCKVCFEDDDDDLRVDWLSFSSLRVLRKTMHETKDLQSAATSSPPVQGALRSTPMRLQRHRKRSKRQAKRAAPRG